MEHFGPGFQRAEVPGHGPPYAAEAVEVLHPPTIAIISTRDPLQSTLPFRRPRFPRSVENVVDRVEIQAALTGQTLNEFDLDRYVDRHICPLQNIAAISTSPLRPRSLTVVSAAPYSELSPGNQCPPSAQAIAYTERRDSGSQYASTVRITRGPSTPLQPLADVAMQQDDWSQV